MKNKFKKESKEFKKYWDLNNKNKLTKAHTEELIGFYNKYEDARNKCTAAILLSFIDNDDRVPSILFDALKYWNDSGYGGWVVTSNARLYNYYPKFRDRYLGLMFNGKFNERDILANSLFFFQDELRETSYKDVYKILQDFLDKEKDQRLKRTVLFKYLLDKLSEATAGKSDYNKFEEDFYTYFVTKVKDGDLTEKHEDFFTDIQERFEYTSSNPNDEDRKYGYIDFEEFKKWLKEKIEKDLANI